MEQPRAVVIGAGVGGLTAAAALHRRGWSVTVLERAAALDPVGAGIALAPNAQRALDTLGLGDGVRALAAWQGAGELRTPGGRRLARMDSAAAAERFGGPVVLLHRATLVELLTAQLPEGRVRTGAPAELTDPGDAGRPARVTTADGEYEADLVVGADGVHSAVRRALFPAHPGPRYAGFTTWRLVVPAPSAPSHRMRPGAGGSSGAVSRCATAGSTRTRRPSPRPVATPPTTRMPNCSGSSATGTGRSPTSSRPPDPAPSCAMTCGP